MREGESRGLLQLPKELKQSSQHLGHLFDVALGTTLTSGIPFWFYIGNQLLFRVEGMLSSQKPRI